MSQIKKDIPTFIYQLNDSEDLKVVMDRAQEQGREDVYQTAFKRYCEVVGRSYEDDLEKDFYETLSAYERLLSEKNGKNQKASRTRQKIKNKGFKACLEDWALSKQPSEGFLRLVENGLAEYTAEYVVTRHPDKFSDEVLASAIERLEKYEVKV